MSTQNRKFIKYAFRLILAVFFSTGIFARCANQVAPQGGPKDTLPPVVKGMRPADYSTNFNTKRIFVEFDEYVKLADLQKEFYTSPAMRKRPEIRSRKKGIQIDILDDSLLSNTTYALNFGSSIQDNNEGNPLNGFRYVFSTGAEIDSLAMSGYTVDAFKGDSVSKAFIWFFDPKVDSIPEYDSVMFLNKAEVIARAENNGIFLAQNLKSKQYRIYAFQDSNNNNMYDPGSDMAGFLDTVYNPLHMPPFNAWQDTTRNYLVADPQLYFRMFKEELSKRQLISKSRRSDPQKATLVFGAPNPEIEEISFEGIDSADVITEYLSPTRDSISYWFNVPPQQLPDTIRGRITFMKHDSLNELISTTQELKLAWKLFETPRQERQRKEREEARQAAIDAGEEPEPEPNLFKHTFTDASVLNPEKGFDIEFATPLAYADTSYTFLWEVPQPEPQEAQSAEKKEDSPVPMRMTFIRDSLNPRKWHINSDEWEPGMNAKFVIPAGKLADIAGYQNDSISMNIRVMDPKDYSVVHMEITGKTDEDQYILRVLNEQGQPVGEISHAVTGTYTFNYLTPGEIQFNVIEDVNGNGIWDTGKLIQRVQPERTEIYMSTPGEPLFTARANYEYTMYIDMEELFAPVTMQAIMKKLEQQETVRLKKLREEAAQKAAERQGQEQEAPPDSFQNYGPGSNNPGVGLPGMQPMYPGMR